MPETVPLYDDMRVYDYLRYMGQLRHLDNLDDRVEDVLEKIGLIDRVRKFDQAHLKRDASAGRTGPGPHPRTGSADP